MEPNKILNNLHDIVNSIEEPAFIVINIGEEAYFAGNYPMHQQNALQKSSAFHMVTGLLSDELAEWEEVDVED